MATLGLPAFGDTVVTKLDIGQPGSTRRTSGDASYPANVNRGAPQTVEVENKFPQQSFVILDNLGFAGHEVTWSGNLRTKTVAIFKDIINELEQLKSGQTVDVNTGVRGTVDPKLMQADVLVDQFGVVMTQRAKLRTYVFGNGRQPVGGGFLVLIPLTITFEVLE